MTKQTPGQQIALWAEKLRDISAMGLMHSQDSYDLERCEAIQAIAMEMTALVLAEPLEKLEPVRDSLFKRPTPLTTGDGAIIDDSGKIFLIQRADTAKWAMPGGALNVGETPAEGVIREVLEETGLACRPILLAGVYDSRLSGTIMVHHLYHFVFLCKPENSGKISTPSHAHEVLNTQWFPEDALPRQLHPGHAFRIQDAYRVWHGDHRAHFDW